MCVLRNPLLIFGANRPSDEAISLRLIGFPAPRSILGFRAVSGMKPRQPVQEHAVMINRPVEQLQLMTIEEATRLSYGDSQRDSHKSERQSIWAWQTVEG